MYFRDKVVVVTGAGSGIGEQLTYRLLRENALVILAGRRREKLEQVIGNSARPGNAMAVPTDVTRLSDLEHLVQAATDAHGRIDILVNNAGTAISGPIEDIPSADAEYQIKVNLVGAIWLTQLALPILKKQPAAMIVNVSSMAGLVAPPYQSVYSGSKYGLRGFSEALRRELLGSSVKVLTAYPGTVASELINDDVQRKMQQVGFGKVSGVMRPEDVVDMLISAMKKERDKAILAGKERALVEIERWAPRLLDRLLHKLSPKMKEILQEVNKWSQTRTSTASRE